MKTVEEFFCFSLEATAHFFGWLGGFYSVIVIIVLSCIVENNRATVELLKHNGDAFRHSSVLNSAQISDLQDWNNDLTWSSSYSTPVALSAAADNTLPAISIFIFCINVIINVCLVLGTIRKLEKLVLPWLIASPFLAVLLFAYMTYLSFSIHFSVILIPASLLLTLNIYLWIAMKSLYTKIKTENGRGQAAPNVDTLTALCIK